MEANDKEKQRQEKILSDDSNRGDNTYFPRAVAAAEGPVPSQVSSHLLSRQQQILAV